MQVWIQWAASSIFPFSSPFLILFSWFLCLCSASVSIFFPSLFLTFDCLAYLVLCITSRHTGICFLIIAPSEFRGRAGPRVWKPRVSIRSIMLPLLGAMYVHSFLWFCSTRPSMCRNSNTSSVLIMHVCNQPAEASGGTQNE